MARNRNSSIECLKLIGIFILIVSHVVGLLTNITELEKGIADINVVRMRMCYQDCDGKVM